MRHDMQTTRNADGGLSPYFQDLAREQPITVKQERALIGRYLQTGDSQAADRLVRSNLRFVVTIAKRYRYYGFPLEDLIQEGNIGLIKALERFDPEKGTRLMTYAAWWIRAGIHEYILNNWSLVKMGTTQAQRRLFVRLMATNSEEGTDAAVADVAERFGKNPEVLRQMAARVRMRDRSLEAPATNPGSADESAPKMELKDSLDLEGELIKRMDTRHKCGQMWRAMSNLDTRDREVLLSRYREDSPATLGDLGKILGVSRERVRQIQVRALARLRMAMVVMDAPEELAA